MKQLIIYILLFAFYGASANTYYISNVGSDASNGLTTATSWATLTKVNASTFAIGDSILLRRGDTFNGFLLPKSNTVIGSYGSGELPIISGAKAAGTFINVSGNIWKVNTTIGASTNTTIGRKDISNVIFNNDAICGNKRLTYGAMTAQGDYYYSPTGDSLYLYSTSNPNTFYTDIKVAGVYSQYVIRLITLSNVTIENLDVRYSGNDAIWMNNCNGITVKNCKVSYAGGWYFDNAGVRMGNGIQIWEGNSNIEVSNNIINQIYDAGVSPQGNAVGYTQSNISMHHNTISNCYYSYELFIRSPNTFSNITFEYNTCINAGRQWSQTQRTDSADAEHIRQAVATGSYTGLKIRYNTFNGSTVRYAQMDCSVSGMQCDYNTIINSTPVFGRFESVNYPTIATWRSASGFDVNSNTTTGNRRIYLRIRKPN